MHQKLNPLKNKKILICITGSIAAYKTCELIRILKKQEAEVKVMMSKSAEKFVGKATFAALTNNEVMSDLFPDTPKAGLEHIELSFDLDLIIVMPATANILSKTANGIADDIISTTLSVCEQPTIFTPAMNYKMWQNPSIMGAVDKLKSMKKIIVEPEKGYLASLHEGEGRLASIDTIMNTIRDTLEIKQPLKNKNIIVTAGPTLEPIDPVRFISNHSSGKMGYAIADAACNFGANVTLISGPVHLNAHPEAQLINITTAKELQSSFEKINLQKIDYIFMCAAVADYGPIKIKNKKIKKETETLNLDLKENPDIIKIISQKTDAIIIAFALETDQGRLNAKNKLKNKNADFVVLNYANEKGAGFNTNTNHVYIYSKDGKEIELKKDRKDRIAHKIIEWVLN
jgi:phosphopantothenoylcysteine decarboxylase/phosphopantothenate--cysteine ligase